MCNYYPWCFSLSPSLPAALGFSLPGAGTSAAAFQEWYSVSANPHWPLQRLLPRCSPTRQPWREFRALPLDWNTENTNLLVNFGPACFDFNSYEWAAQTWKFDQRLKMTSLSRRFKKKSSWKGISLRSSASVFIYSTKPLLTTLPMIHWRNVSKENTNDESTMTQV